MRVNPRLLSRFSAPEMRSPLEKTVRLRLSASHFQHSSNGVLTTVTSSPRTINVVLLIVSARTSSLDRDKFAFQGGGHFNVFNFFNTFNRFNLLNKGYTVNGVDTVCLMWAEVGNPIGFEAE